MIGSSAVFANSGKACMKALRRCSYAASQKPFARGLLIVLVCVVPGLEEARAQLDQDCVVTVLNRTVQVNPDGTWVVPNVPANLCQVRARATCVKNGITRSGQSVLFTTPPNGVVGPLAFHLAQVDPVPASLSITAPANILATVGATVRLTVTSTFFNAPSRDL